MTVDVRRQELLSFFARCSNYSQCCDTPGMPLGLAYVDTGKIPLEVLFFFGIQSIHILGQIKTGAII
jgi:hypothetical protein